MQCRRSRSDGFRRFGWGKGGVEEFLRGVAQIAQATFGFLGSALYKLSPMAVRVSWRYYDNVRTLPPAFRRWPNGSHPAGDLLATKQGTVADPASIGGTPGPERSDVFRLQQK